ncbi:hypothetical protein HC891_16925, partial [Candidatus Gracilibacteria bacterium]|nr:hypothetical protein [Candidatus Gracilibacteria bacterium]
MTNIPALSVILVTPSSYATLTHTMRFLRAQTLAEQIEVVIVASSQVALALPPGEQGALGGIRVVEAGTPLRLGAAKAAGVAAARAAVVVFAEDHCSPRRNGAALIAAHAEPWAAVGPAIGNANPVSAISWANLLLAYGHWLAPATAGEIADVPGHNSSYKRTLLLAYGEQLSELLEREGTLHADLRVRGHRLYLAAEARADHVNPTLPSAWVPLRFNAGRLYAAVRARGWSPLRRAL